MTHIYNDIFRLELFILTWFLFGLIPGGRGFTPAPRGGSPGEEIELSWLSECMNLYSDTVDTSAQSHPCNLYCVRVAVCTLSPSRFFLIPIGVMFSFSPTYVQVKIVDAWNNVL